MLAKSSAFTSSDTARPSSVWRLLLLDTCAQTALVQKDALSGKYHLPASPCAPEMATLKPAKHHAPHAAPPETTDMHHQLTSICLRNPSWNNFRLLYQLRKLNPEITLETLQRLKQDCDLDSREAVCNILLRRLFSSCSPELSNTQLSFIYRIHPELYDRDVQPSQPGELLIYESFFARSQKGVGRLYIHVFADMFNGWIFARISPRRSVRSGSRILQDHIAPIYRNLGYTIQKILHTSRECRDVREVALLSATQGLSAPGIQWEAAHRQFGTIKHFRQHLATSSFHESSHELEASVLHLHANFAKLLKEYNADCDFNQRRPLLRIMS